MNPEVLSSLYVLAALFFVVAFVYSSIGLGGGTSYVALMTIFGVNTLAIPTISLLLNLIVSSAGSINFIRGRHARLPLILPFLVSSIPMAYLGGALEIQPEKFNWILLASLVFVAARIFFWKHTALSLNPGRVGRILISLAAGSILGLIAGIVGIAGGIFLVPLIIVLGLGTEKEAAACGAILVWLNSLSGLVSRLQHNTIDLSGYLPLIAAVLAGGILGSWLGASKFSPATMERILGVVTIVAIVFLARRLWTA